MAINERATLTFLCASAGILVAVQSMLWQRALAENTSDAKAPVKQTPKQASAGKIIGQEATGKAGLPEKSAHQLQPPKPEKGPLAPPAKAAAPASASKPVPAAHASTAAAGPAKATAPARANKPVPAAHASTATAGPAKAAAPAGASKPVPAAQASASLTGPGKAATPAGASKPVPAAQASTPAPAKSKAPMTDANGKTATVQPQAKTSAAADKQQAAKGEEKDVKTHDDSHHSEVAKSAHHSKHTQHQPVGMFVPPPPPETPTMMPESLDGLTPIEFMTNELAAQRSKDLRSQLENEKATLSDKQKLVQDKKDRAAQFESLYNEGVISRRELEAAHQEADQLISDVNKEQARVTMLQQMLSRLDGRLKGARSSDQKRHGGKAASQKKKTVQAVVKVVTPKGSDVQSAKVTAAAKGSQDAKTVAQPGKSPVAVPLSPEEQAARVEASSFFATKPANPGDTNQSSSVVRSEAGAQTSAPAQPAVNSKAAKSAADPNSSTPTKAP